MLFACSKCFSRHPFEELSPGQQLCKDCRGSFPIVKCTYCRTEFQQTSKGSTSAICKKCDQNVKQYGKPSACELCNIIAAFIGSKCQRCTNSELKYGPAVTCDQCKQRCAFNRPDYKVDGKLLCWLCTLSYKRALTKARQAESDRRRAKKRGAESGGPPSSMSGSFPGSGSGGPINTRNTVPLGLNSGNSSSRDRNRDRGGTSDKANSSSSSGNRGGGGDGGISGLPPLADLGMGLEPMEIPESVPSVGSSAGGMDRVDSGRNDNGRHSSGKKPRTDIKGGGIPEIPEKVAKSANSGYVDPHSSDHVIAMTQLKETIATLQRKIKQKDSIILEKEKEISAWKGKHLYLEQELMKKYKDMEKNYEFKVDVLNKKLKSQLLEIAQLSKAAKDAAEKKKKPAMFLATTKLHKLKADSSKEKSSEKSGGRIRIEDDDDDDDKEDKSNDSDKASEKGSGSGRNTPKEAEGKESPRDVDSGKESPRDSDKEDEKEEDEREKSPKKESDSEKEKDDEQSKSNGSAKGDEESDKEEEEEKKDEDEEKKNEEEEDEKEDRNSEAGSRRNSDAGSRRNSESGSRRNSEAGSRRNSEAGSRRNSEHGSDKESDNESDDRSAKGSESDGDDRSAKGSDKDSGSDSGSDRDSDHDSD